MITVAQNRTHKLIALVTVDRLLWRWDRVEPRLSAFPARVRKCDQLKNPARIGDNTVRLTLAGMHNDPRRALHRRTDT